MTTEQNKDNETMISIFPVAGIFEVKIIKLISEENKSLNEIYDHFVILFEIVSGAEKGMQFTIGYSNR